MYDLKLLISTTRQQSRLKVFFYSHTWSF